MTTFTYDGTTNINTAFATTDLLFITSTSAASFNVAQVGSNTVLTDKTNGHTITLQNFAMTQFQDNFGPTGPGPDNIQFFDSSKLMIGDNTTDAGADNNNQNYIVGVSPFLTTEATPFNDQIYGMGGNDTIRGGGGSDLIYGNTGNDSITATGNTAGNDTVFGGQGNDTIDYQNVLTDQAHPVSNQLIYGNVGNDVFYGGDSNDTVFGGQGNDLLFGNNGTDLIYGNIGTDSIFGGDGNDTVFGGQDADLIRGGDGSDLIYGQLGDDVLWGEIGNDTIFGGQGQDLLYGGLGKDVMTGGVGSDTFNYDADGVPISAQSGVTTATADVIVDFVTGIDKVDFEDGDTAMPGVNYQEITASTVTSVEQAAAINTGGFEYTFVAGKNDGYLLFDLGNGTANAVIVLQGLNNTNLFNASDIITTDLIS